MQREAWMRQGGDQQGEKGKGMMLKKPLVLEGEVIPTTMPAALRRFFLGEEHAPRFLVAALAITSTVRIGGPFAVGVADVWVMIAVAIFWAFQEWWMHKYLLHAPFQWLGTGKQRLQSTRRETILEKPTKRLV